MPNKRKKDKRNINVWLTPEEKSQLESVAEQLNLSMSDLIKLAIETEAKRLGLNTKEEKGANNEKHNK